MFDTTLTHVIIDIYVSMLVLCLAASIMCFVTFLCLSLMFVFKLWHWLCWVLNYFLFPVYFLGWINQIAKRRDKLLNYMLFLRITPTLPNLFINLASPIVDVPFHIFFFATLIGLIPAAYITVRVSFSSYLTVIYFTIFLLYYIEFRWVSRV
jgi:hypothetical protein